MKKLCECTKEELIEKAGKGIQSFSYEELLELKEQAIRDAACGWASTIACMTPVDYKASINMGVTNMEVYEALDAFEKNKK